MQCPKCQAELEPIGQLDYDGQSLPVFQCEVCTVSWDVEGESFPAALTFAVTPNGDLIDPGSCEPLGPIGSPGEN